MKNLITTTTLSLFLFAAIAQTEKKLQPFSSIQIESNAKVIVKQDSMSSVTYEGAELRDLDDISVKNNTLIIAGIPSGEIHVSTPTLDKIVINGIGSVTGETPIKTSEILIDINGDGKVSLEIYVERVNAKISGLGKITLSGTAQEANFTIPGSGKIEAIDLKTIRCNANISGLGKCSIDVIDELNSMITGSGTVSYKTMPKKLSESNSGVGKTKSYDGDVTWNENPDTTRIELGESQLWIISKKDTIRSRKHKVKPIWQGFEMGVNSYLDNGGSFDLGPGKENWELRLEKSIYVSLNFFQTSIELGHSNVHLFTGLGITWNNYRFENNIVLDNGSTTVAYVDSTPGVQHIKSKLVASYLTAPVMLEVFTSRRMKHAFHLGAGMMFGFRLGSHTKQKISVDGDASKIKQFDDFNLSPFRYGFRVAIGYGKFNVFADYYASTLFRNNRGPVLYPINAGITLVGF